MKPQELNIAGLISERIRGLIQRSGSTQSELAKALGVTQGAVSGWCNGAQPRLDQLIKVAHYFGTSLEWLLTGDEEGGGGIWGVTTGSPESDDPRTDEEFDALLEKVMLSLPGPDLQKAVDYTRETIRDLRAQAEVFSQHAQNLLIDAERMEEHLNSFIAQSRMVAKGAQKAARTLDARYGTKKGPGRKK